MLVAAGLEHKTPAEIADAYEAAFHADEAAVNILPAHVFPRATEHIPEMLTLAEALEDLGYAYATAGGQRLLRRRAVRRLRPAVGQHPGRPAGRSPRRHRAGQARSGRLRAVEGGRPGPAPEVAERALGRGLPRLAHRVLGDGDALSRAAVRHPHRRHRQRLPAPRGRDRPVDADRRRRPGPHLGPRRVPADGRQEDGQVGRQLPARHRAGRPRPRSARLPLPGPDVALLAQARVLGPLDRGGRSGARVAAGRPARRSAPPPADGPWARAAGPPRGRGRRSPDRDRPGRRPATARSATDPFAHHRSRGRADRAAVGGGPRPP